MCVSRARLPRRLHTLPGQGGRAPQRGQTGSERVCTLQHGQPPLDTASLAQTSLLSQGQKLQGWAPRAPGVMMGAPG